MYYTGTGVPQDFSAAAKWVRRAAEQGYARAQLDLGYLYEQGKGVPVDYISAYAWYDAALDRGEKRATRQLKNLSSLMTGQQTKQAIEAAAKLKQSIPSAPVYASSESLRGSFLPPH